MRIRTDHIGAVNVEQTPPAQSPVQQSEPFWHKALTGLQHTMLQNPLQHSAADAHTSPRGAQPPELDCALTEPTVAEVLAPDVAAWVVAATFVAA